MKLPYNSPNPNTGVLTYELLGPPGQEAIILEFKHSHTRYLYNADAPGPTHVRAMIRLATQGKGLSTYINQHVREHYAAKLPR